MKTNFKTRMLGAAFGVGALFGGVALADDAVTATGNIALSTDYLFRGISQTGSEPAVSGGFDVSSGMLYAGTWASSLGNQGVGGPMELDLYAGIKPTTGPINWDVGVIGYLYPSASDDLAETNYYEGYIKGSITPAPGFTLGVSGFWSPDFYGERDNAYYIEGNAAFALSSAISVSGAVGYQDISDANGPGLTSPDANYTTWNAGATYTLGSWAFDLRYIDSDIDTGPTDAMSAVTNEHDTKGRAVFTIKKAL